MTVFDTGPKAMTADFNAGDIGYVKKGLGHYVQNVGNTDLIMVEVFRLTTLRRWRCPTGSRIHRLRWSCKR